MTPTETADGESRPAWSLMGGGLPLAALLVLAAVLRLFRLNDQYWIDEFSALDSIRRPVWLVLTEWPGYASHIFFEALASVSVSVFGDHPFAIRLPAALFGVAGVWLIHRLVSRWFDSTTALVVAGLFAVSYHHVQFSQNARGYTTLMAFFLLATLLLDVMRREGRVRGRVGVGYGVSAALSAYAQMFGVFVAAGHLAAMLGAAAVSRLRGREFGFPVRGLIGGVVLAGALTLLAYLPLLSDILGFAETSVADPGEGPRAGVGVLFEIVEGLQAAFFGPIGLTIAVAIGMVGMFAWVRVQPLIMASFVAPLVVELLTFAAIGAGIHPRYFAIALPVVFLVGGVGVVRTVTALVGKLPLTPNVAARVAHATLLVVVLLSAVPLRRYYSMPKQDYLGAVEVMNDSAAEGDIKAGVHLAIPVNDFYDAGFEEVMVLDDLLRLEERGARVWLVTTLERLLLIQDADLFAHIHERYRPVTELPGSVGDGAMRIYVR